MCYIHNMHFILNIFNVFKILKILNIFKILKIPKIFKVATSQELILCCSTTHSQKSWKLARKEESRPHKSSCPGSVKSNKFRARGTFCTS